MSGAVVKHFGKKAGDLFATPAWRNAAVQQKGFVIETWQTKLNRLV